MIRKKLTPKFLLALNEAAEKCVDDAIQEYLNEGHSKEDFYKLCTEMPDWLDAHDVVDKYLKHPHKRMWYKLDGYDLIVSSESGPIKGIRKPKGARHVCYCHTPMRYLWDMHDEYYRDAAQVLAEKIRRFYWKDELGAFIDSYQSGKNHVTRHANIFALLYGFANEEERRSIITNVIRNDAITAITTPYFKFFELEAMARLGDIDYLMRNLREYWGGMIHEGSTTIWEGYIPGVPAVEQYAMYGRPFDKSL